tara:strand:+ start:134 stop:529 length:396 start_codon:yes stop_codon:yes gene_type:complete
MSTGIAVQLPLIQDKIDGFYLLIKDYETLSRQNLKMLLLTNPGERIMDPNFGVGIRKYLFDLSGRYTFAVMRSGIQDQVQKYLPFLEIQDVRVNEGPENMESTANTVSVLIVYKIVPLQFQGVLQIDMDNN